MTSLILSGPPTDEVPLEVLPPAGTRLGYELAVRFGRSL